MLTSCGGGDFGKYKVEDLESEGLSNNQIDSLRKVYYDRIDEYKAETKLTLEYWEKLYAKDPDKLKELKKIDVEEGAIESAESAIDKGITDLKETNWREGIYAEANQYIKDLLDGKFSKNPKAFKEVVTPLLKQCKKEFFEAGTYYPDIIFNQIILGAENIYIAEGKEKLLKENNNPLCFTPEIIDTDNAFDVDENGYWIYPDFGAFVRDIHLYYLSLGRENNRDQEHYLRFIESYYINGYYKRLYSRAMFINPGTLEGVTKDHIDHWTLSKHLKLLKEYRNLSE
jgi:hypothetical protein